MALDDFSGSKSSQTFLESTLFFIGMFFKCFFWGSGNFSERRVKIGALIRVAKLFLCVIVRDSEIFCLHILCISCGVTVLYLSLRGYNSTKQLSTSVLS